MPIRNPPQRQQKAEDARQQYKARQQQQQQQQEAEERLSHRQMAVTLASDCDDEEIFVTILTRMDQYGIPVAKVK